MVRIILRLKSYEIIIDFQLWHLLKSLVFEVDLDLFQLSFLEQEVEQ